MEEMYISLTSCTSMFSTSRSKLNQHIFNFLDLLVMSIPKLCLSQTQSYFHCWPAVWSAPLTLSDLDSALVMAQFERILHPMTVLKSHESQKYHLKFSCKPDMCSTTFCFTESFRETPVSFPGDQRGQETLPVSIHPAVTATDLDVQWILEFYLPAPKCCSPFLEGFCQLCLLKMPRR